MSTRMIRAASERRALLEDGKFEEYQRKALRQGGRHVDLQRHAHLRPPRHERAAAHRRRISLTVPSSTTRRT